MAGNSPSPDRFERCGFAFPGLEIYGETFFPERPHPSGDKERRTYCFHCVPFWQGPDVHDRHILIPWESTALARLGTLFLKMNNT